MPSILNDSSPSDIGRAEAGFRAAFERLKRGTPNIVPAKTPVSQNNVAKEAGRDPSALKKNRYPELIRDIQQWIAQHSKTPSRSAHRATLAARRRNRSLKDKMDLLQAERDIALSLLVEADARILDLTTENARLKALVEPARVTSIRSHEGKLANESSN